MNRHSVPAAPPPPPLGNLRRVAAKSSTDGHNHNPPSLPNGTNRPLPAPPKSKSLDQPRGLAPALPPGKPRAQSLGPTSGTPPPPPQRSRPMIQRQEARRESGAPSLPVHIPCPDLGQGRSVSPNRSQGRAISMDQSQGHRRPPPLPPRDRAVSMDEKITVVKKPSVRTLSDPGGAPTCAPPLLPVRPLPTIPSTHEQTMTAGFLTSAEQQQPPAKPFEDDFIFPPKIDFPPPETFIPMEKSYPSRSAAAHRDTRNIPP